MTNHHNAEDPRRWPVDARRTNRIKQLRAEIKKLCGDVVFGESDNCPPEVLEQFLERVLAVERASTMTQVELLARAGVHLAPPDKLDDAALHEELWRLIRALEKQHTFIYRTNHLSDRELYVHLLTVGLQEEVIGPLDDPNSCYHIDILGGCSEEDINLDMKYYADEIERARWLEDFPDYQMPPHEDPPYDRDRLLPQRGCPWDGPRPNAGKN